MHYTSNKKIYTRNGWGIGDPYALTPESSLQNNGSEALTGLQTILHGDSNLMEKFVFLGTPKNFNYFNSMYQYSMWNEIFKKKNFTDSNNWTFSSGYWLSLHMETNVENSSMSIFWEKGYFFNAIILFFYFYFTIKMVNSKTIQQAISSFFMYILISAIALIYMLAEYVAVVVVMVYAGAVIIFFIFILFTMDPKQFYTVDNQYRLTTNKIKENNFFNEFAFITGLMIMMIESNFSFNQPKMLANTTLWWQNIMYSQAHVRNHPITTFGNLFFSDYWVATTALAVLLLVVLLFSIRLLTFSRNKNKMNFYKTYIQLSKK